MGDSADLLAKLGRSCKGHVDLSASWLTEKEIAEYSSVEGCSFASQNYSTKHSLRDVPRTNAEMFDSYKKSREQYLNRRLHQSSTEMTDFGGFSGDEFSNPSDEEYSKGSRAHKRKRLAYEDDLEWSPNSDGKHHPTEKRVAVRHRKIGLRVNTRRKRIESSSSSDDDFYYNGAKYQTKDSSDAKKLQTHGDISVSKGVTSLKKKVPVTPNTKNEISKISRDSAPLIDTDLLSKIMHEMSDYNKKNSKPSNKSNENARIDKSNGDQSNAEIDHYPQVKKRRSHLFKITDEDVTPRLTSVQQIVRKMVNQVCSSEKKRKLLSSPGGSRRKICKWCDVPITNSNNKVDNDLCTKCRNVVKDSLNRTKASKIGISSKPKAGNKIKNKLYKNLPKYDQQRLAYSGQADKSSVSKGYNHCKSLVTLKDLDSSGSVEKTTKIKSPEKIKLKNKTKDLLKKKTKDSADATYNSKINKKKKKGISDSEKNGKLSNPKIKNSTSLAVNKTIGEKKQKHVSVTNVNKGLFLMTFPEPNQELEIPAKEINTVSVNDKNVEKSATVETIQNQLDLSLNKSKQAMTNNVQYGNYLLPPVPTVVVANYAATDAKSGDYYLSSVYYQNEMTRSKNTPLRSEGIVTVTAPGSLPSMPSLDQFTTVSPSPTFSFPQPACHLNSLPVTEFSLPAGINTSNSLLLQQHMMSPTNISIPTYSPQDNVNIFNNAHEVASASYPASIESDISALLNNSELQIQGLQPKDSDDAFNLFDSQELNLAETYEDNSNLHTENCNQDFGAIIRNAVSENLQAANFDNDSLNSETQTKHSDSTESMDTDTSKVPEQNMDLNQNSTVAGNNSEENSFYQSDTENLSSEALLEYCSSELDALCILGVVDLDKNPKWTLKRRIDFNKSEVEKLKNSEMQDRTRLKCLELSGRTLQIASVLLNRFGSFTRVSDSILRKQRLLQIKKEKGLELEETRSSCQFAKSVPSTPMPCQIEPIKTIDNMAAEVRLKMENAQSCSFPTRVGESVNHIEKIQTQIQSMQENPMVTVGPGQLELVHHFPVPDMPVASNITPRTEMMSEFRETPSRGSGPRTPARPESAMSQNDDTVLTPQQIKKERLEASNSDLSQCAFSQNTTPSPRYVPNTTPTSTPNMQQIPSGNNLAVVSLNTQLVNALGNQRHHTAAPTASINNNSSQIQKVIQHAGAYAASTNSNNMQIQKVMQMHQGQVGPPNVTVPFPTGNQNFNKVVVSKQLALPPPSNVMANLNAHPSTNVIVRNNYMNVQPVNVPGATGGQLFQRYIQASVPAGNNNSYAYKQTMNSGGTMLVNNMGQNYALANPHVMNQQQMPRVYNAGNVQQSLQVPNPVNQAPPNTAYLMPNSKPEEPTPMTCAVCNKPATLRCKQCAKVAYCDTVCAKNYWHEKHKMECKMMLGNI